MKRALGLGALVGSKDSLTVPDYSQLFRPTESGEYVGTSTYPSSGEQRIEISKTAELVKDPDYDYLFRPGQSAIVKD